MQPEHAEHTLEVIRTLMERSQRYEHISGHSGLGAGGAVLLGGALLGAGLLPFGDRANFALVWSGVFTAAFTGHLALTWARARQRGERVWSRQARTVLLAVLPGFLGALAITGLLWRYDRWEWLPALWLLFYGCGALATSFFAARSIWLLGLACFALGALATLLGLDRPTLTMTIGFGLTHLIFGASVVLAEWREERELNRWITCQENSPN